MVVSNCCGGEIYSGRRKHFPLGGTVWHETEIIDVCEICGKECELVEVSDDDGDQDANHHEAR